MKIQSFLQHSKVPFKHILGMSFQNSPLFHTMLRGTPFDFQGGMEVGMDEVFFKSHRWVNFFYSKVTISPPNFGVGMKFFSLLPSTAKCFFFLLRLVWVGECVCVCVCVLASTAGEVFFFPQKTSMPPWISNGAPLKPL